MSLIRRFYRGLILHSEDFWAVRLLRHPEWLLMYVLTRFYTSCLVAIFLHKQFRRRERAIYQLHFEILFLLNRCRFIAVLIWMRYKVIGFRELGMQSDRLILLIQYAMKDWGMQRGGRSTSVFSTQSSTGVRQKLQLEST